MNTVARFGPHRTIGWSVNQRWQGLCHKHTPHLAPVVECASKTIPALSDRVLGHLAKVDEHISLCGLTTARNSLICSSTPPVWKDFDLSQCLVWAKPLGLANLTRQGKPGTCKFFFDNASGWSQKNLLVMAHHIPPEETRRNAITHPFVAVLTIVLLVHHSNFFCHPYTTFSDN